MISSWKHYSSVALTYAKLAIQQQLEYPAFLLSWILLIPMQYFAGVWMLGVIIERFNSLSGWTFHDITFLYGLALVSHGIMVTLFIPTWSISGRVIRGDFDRLLVRPMNVFFQMVAGYFNFIGLIDLVPGVVIFLFGCFHADIAWSVFSVIKILLVIFGAVLIRAAFFTMLGATAFWTKSSNSLVALGLKTIEQTTTYPLSMYPKIIQGVFTFLMPFGFISFYPASDLLGKQGMEFPLDFSLLTPLIGILMFTISTWMFHQGMRRYESAGS